MRIACSSDIVFALAASFIWLLFYNRSFWHQTLVATWQPSFQAALFLASLSILVLTIQAVLLLLAPTRRALRIFASALFMIAAVGSYFVSAYGVLLDKEMLRNVMQTDAAEIGGVLGPGLALHVFILGLLPALLVWRVDLPATHWKSRSTHRAVFSIIALGVSLAGVFVSSASYAVFFREHKPIRYTLVPVTPIASAIGLSMDNWKRVRRTPLLDLSGAVQRTARANGKPLVLFLVVGETARAANFQLGGYGRPTNPRLSAIDDLVYFDRTSSCGTATAISLPCLFSHFGRDRFDVDEARNYTNVLDTLVKGGFDVQWRDNNSGCKGVCARIAHVQYLPSRTDSEHCPNSYCFDEVMLTDLADKLSTIERDTAIVFHQIGSHGPAYSERYPARFEVFKPACRSAQLQRCTRTELINAYDNTIAYTDYVLSRHIELLRAAEGRVDSVLIYISDHGESLGERGMYLHGMPYEFAPAIQKEVPLLIWTSRGYADRTRLSVGCLRATAHQPFSHDNLYHTVLGATQVRNALYDPNLDMFDACRPTQRQRHQRQHR